MPLIRYVARRAFHQVGGIRFVRYMRRTGIRILVYHRFPSEPRVAEMLEQQCAHIARHYRPMTLDAAVHAIRTRRPLPRHAIAVTVDDGYRDFLSYAAPTFRKFHIPVTMFVTSDFIDGTSWLWVDQIRYAFLNTAHKKIDSQLFGTDRGIWHLEDRAGQLEAAGHVKALAKSLPNSERLELLRKIPAILGVNLPESPPSEDSPLNWQEIRSLQHQGVQFGAHTRTHPVLSHISDPEILKAEIAGSRRRIEQELQTPAEHFCYPNGRVGDYCDLTVRVTQDAGFQSAVTTTPGMNDNTSDLFALKRIVVEPYMPQPVFAEICAVFRLQAKGIF